VKLQFYLLFYIFQASTVTLREKHRLRIVQWIILGPKAEDEKIMKWYFITYILHPVFLGYLNRGRLNGQVSSMCGNCVFFRNPQQGNRPLGTHACIS
jgi:hypothetical protein